MNKLIERFGSDVRWVNWRYEMVDGKQTKVPYAISGRKASTTNPETWATYETVKNVSDKVGIILKSDQLLLGIDIDHCIKDRLITHEQKETIEHFINQADTYMEVSPSETGLHIFLILTEPFSPIAHKKAPYEVYSSGRYLTFTGIPYMEEKEIRVVTSNEAIRLLKIIGYPWAKEILASNLGHTAPSSAPMEIGDMAVLEKMFSARNGDKIKSLYNGDISAYGGDDSSADMALCSHLAFWTGKNSTQMERLWVTSPLGLRQKVQERKDYRDRTIKGVIDNCAKVYLPNRNEIEYMQKKSTSDIWRSNASQAVTVCLADVKSEPIRWLWPGRIALGKLTLISGDPGLGKSLLTTTLAANISRGYLWPLTDTTAAIGDTLFLSAEDDAADTIKPRLEAIEADCRRIHIIQAVKNTDANGSSTEHMFSLRNDLPVLEKLLSAMFDCRLLVIDPISAYLDETESHNNSAVRGLLAPLAALASKYHVAIVLVSHLNKGNATKALYRSMGSLAFAAAARVAYLVTKDKDNPEKILFLPVKNNLAKDTTGLSYSVVTADNGSAIMAWGTESVIIPADLALAPPVIDGEPNATDEAVDFLRDLLSRGPKKAQDCEKEAKDAGISKKTLRRAREKLEIKPRRADFKNGWWEWALPKNDDAHDAQSKNKGTFDAKGHLPTKTIESVSAEEWFESLPSNS